MLLLAAAGAQLTMLLVACSPHEYNYEESLSTLKFAQRAKQIKTITRINATTVHGIQMPQTMEELEEEKRKKAADWYPVCETDAPARERVEACMCMQHAFLHEEKHCKVAGVYLP